MGASGGSCELERSKEWTVERRRSAGVGRSCGKREELGPFESGMQVVLVALAALGLLGTLCASSDVPEERYFSNSSGVAGREWDIISHIYALVPIWLAMTLVVSAACELKSKKPIDEGPPWSAIGVAR